MSTPWWLTVLVGALTLVGVVYGARVGAGQARVGSDEQATAAAREEWFRRMQWAAGLTLSQDSRSRVAGLALLRILATSPLASKDDLALLSALNENEALDRAERALEESGAGEDNLKVTSEQEGNDE